MTVRAKVWTTGSFVHSGKLYWTWNYKVMNTAGETVLCDNTGAYEPIIRTALIEVKALRHMETAGHRLKPYAAVSEEGKEQ